MELRSASLGGSASRSIGTRVVEESAGWNALLDRLASGQVLQSYAWGEFASRAGWLPVRVAHDRGGRPIAATQLLLRQSSVGRVAYVPRGPSIAPGEDAALPELIEQLHGVARDHQAQALTIEPAWRDDRFLAARLRALGFLPTDALQPRTTLLLDLRADLGSLTAGLSPRTRYNVRAATSHGVTIEPSGEAELPTFYRLLLETSQRSHFSIQPYDYYAALWHDLAGTGQAHLLMARHDGDTVGVAMLLTMGTAAYYMYGGSAATHRDVKPSDFLQWEAIRWARERGCLTYDLGGIPDEVGRETDGRRDDRASSGEESADASRELWGVYHFKRGFGGCPVRYVGAFTYVYEPRRHWLWQVLAPRVRTLAGLFER